MTFREVIFMLGRNSEVNSEELVTIELEELTIVGSIGVENDIRVELGCTEDRVVSVDTVVLMVGEMVDRGVPVITVLNCVLVELSKEKLVLKGATISVFEVNTGEELLTEVDNSELTIVVSRVSDDEGIMTELDGAGCTGLEIALAVDVRTGKDILSVIDLNEDIGGEGFEEVIELVTIGEEVTVDISGTRSI